MSAQASGKVDKSLKRKHEDDSPAASQLTKRQRRREAKKQKALLKSGNDAGENDPDNQQLGNLTPSSLEGVVVQQPRSIDAKKKSSKHHQSIEPPSPLSNPTTGQKPQRKSKEHGKISQDKLSHHQSQFTETESQKHLSVAQPRSNHDTSAVEAQQTRFGWSLTDTKGGLYANRDPIFLGDLLVTAVGQEIRGLHMQTSLVARVLPARSNATIVSFDAVQTPTETLVRVFYSDGVLVDWDWTANRVDESRPAAQSVDIYRLAAASGSRITSVFTTWSGTSCAILIDGIHSYRTQHRIVELRLFHGATFIVAQSENALMIGRKEETEAYTWIELPWAQLITCVEAREVNRAKQKDLDLVVGQEDGSLHLYSNIVSLFSTSSPRLPAARILHWHRTAVGSAKFSHDGTYIISGGQETVLVIWQLATGQKQFLPNLTANIERIVVSPAGNRYALCMGDNSIMVLSTSELKPVANFAGLQMSLDGQVPAVLDPRTGGDRLLLVVPSSQRQLLESRPFLQTYDLRADKHISRQALTRNNITDFNTNPEGIPIKSPDVQHIKLSRDGQWLATLDTWTPPHRDFPYLDTEDGAHEEASRTEVYLKFWQWDADSKTWLLNTRIDQPHASGATPGAVYQLIHDPSRLGFVTVGEDSTVNIWRPQKKVRQGVVISNNDQDEVEWKCRLSIQLEKFLDRSDLELEGLTTYGAAVALSDDGSLMAVALLQPVSRQVIHFIDTSSGEVKLSKDNIAAPALVDLAFMDQYLVILSRQNLRLWDIVKDNLPLKKKIQESDAPMLAVSKQDNAVAVATSSVGSGQSRVYIYRTQPIERSYKIKTSAAVSAILTHPQERGFRLVLDNGTIQTLAANSGLSTAQQLVLAAHDSTDESILDDVRTSIEEVGPSQQEPRYLLDDTTMMLAAEASAQDDRAVVRPEELAKVFDVGTNPSVLPTVRDMFHAVAGLFARKPVNV